jgi:hypothetical protein
MTSGPIRGKHVFVMPQQSFCAGQLIFDIMNHAPDARLVARFIQSPKPVFRPLENVLRSWSIGLMDLRGRMLRLFDRPGKCPSLPPEFRQLRVQEFADDIRLLGSVLNRNLDHWPPMDCATSGDSTVSDRSGVIPS